MKGQRGFSLIETVIAIGILGILAASYFGALSSNLKILIYTDEQQTAKTLAEHQMEYVKNLSYATSYTPAPISDEYSGYKVTISVNEVNSRDVNLQKIRVLIRHNDKPVIMIADSTLQGYKVNR